MATTALPRPYPQLAHRRSQSTLALSPAYLHHPSQQQGHPNPLLPRATNNIPNNSLISPHPLPQDHHTRQQLPPQPNSSPNTTMSQPQVQITLTRSGDGVNRARIRGDVVLINYTACLSDGTVVDATRDRGKSYRLEYQQGDAISGLDWALGRPNMTLGARAKVIIPSCYAYGRRGWPPSIPGDATLYFDLEVVGINHKFYKSDWYETA